VPERVEREVRNLRELAGFRVLALQTRWFDVAALRPRRENPGSLSSSATHFENGLRALRERNSATGVAGLYRKLHPAIRRSVYSAGSAIPVFRAGELTFGIVICYDSTFAEPAKTMAARGATVLFVPTNNAVPTKQAHAGIVQEARAADFARALENGVWVIRADVAGTNGALTSYGSSAIVDPDAKVVQEANLKTTDLLVADVIGRRATLRKHYR
jgi:predicted amidohydrolase